MSWEDWHARDGFSLWRLLRGHIGTVWSEGDCIHADERRTNIWFDGGLSIRDGDLGAWRIAIKGAEHRVGKYLLRIGDEEWLASKEGAKRRECTDQCLGRVVMMIRDSEPIAASKAAEATARLRANPPKRSDFCMFERDLFDLDEMRAAIRAHIARYKSDAVCGQIFRGLEALQPAV